MNSVNMTNARKNLSKIVNNAQETHAPIMIVGRENSAVLISAEDWRSIEETLYLSSIPGMSQSIIDGMREPIEKCADKLDW